MKMNSKETKYQNLGGCGKIFTGNLVALNVAVMKKESKE